MKENNPQPRASHQLRTLPRDFRLSEFYNIKRFNKYQIFSDFFLKSLLVEVRGSKWSTSFDLVRSFLVTVLTFNLNFSFEDKSKRNRFFSPNHVGRPPTLTIEQLKDKKVLSSEGFSYKTTRDALNIIFDTWLNLNRAEKFKYNRAWYVLKSVLVQTDESNEYIRY